MVEWQVGDGDTGDGDKFGLLEVAFPCRIGLRTNNSNDEQQRLRELQGQ